jgi:hypothetical protein
VQNNIMPWKDSSNCAYTCSPFGLFGHALFDFGANLVTPGQVTVAAKIQPTGWSAGGVFHNGVNTSYSYIDGWSLNPINRNLNGFVPANFIPYNRFPVAPDMSLYTGSNAKGVAKPLTGQLAYYPPRFNAVDAAMSPFKPRKDLTTMGPYDPGTITTPRMATAPVGKESDTVPGKGGMAFRCGSHGGAGTCGTVAQVAEGWATKTLAADGNLTASDDYFGTDPACCIVTAQTHLP